MHWCWQLRMLPSLYTYTMGPLYSKARRSAAIETWITSKRKLRRDRIFINNNCRHQRVIGADNERLNNINHTPLFSSICTRHRWIDGRTNRPVTSLVMILLFTKRRRQLSVSLGGGWHIKDKNLDHVNKTPSLHF